MTIMQNALTRTGRGPYKHQRLAISPLDYYVLAAGRVTFSGVFMQLATHYVYRT
jgi:hypothetical protein